MISILLIYWRKQCTERLLSLTDVFILTLYCHWQPAETRTPCNVSQFSVACFASQMLFCCHNQFFIQIELTSDLNLDQVLVCLETGCQSWIITRNPIIDWDDKRLILIFKLFSFNQLIFKLDLFVKTFPCQNLSRLFAYLRDKIMQSSCLVFLDIIRAFMARLLRRLTLISLAPSDPSLDLIIMFYEAFSRLWQIPRSWLISLDFRGNLNQF